MAVRSVLVLFLVATHLFVDSWTMQRQVPATADTDILDPVASIQLTLNGTGFVSSNVNTDADINLTHASSTRVSGPFGGVGANEPDFGDMNPQTFDSFAFKINGSRSMAIRMTTAPDLTPSTVAESAGQSQYFPENTTFT